MKLELIQEFIIDEETKQFTDAKLRIVCNDLDAANKYYTVEETVKESDNESDNVDSKYTIKIYSDVNRHKTGDNRTMDTIVVTSDSLPYVVPQVTRILLDTEHSIGKLMDDLESVKTLIGDDFYCTKMLAGEIYDLIGGDYFGLDVNKWTISSCKHTFDIMQMIKKMIESTKNEQLSMAYTIYSEVCRLLRIKDKKKFVDFSRSITSILNEILSLIKCDGDINTKNNIPVNDISNSGIKSYLFTPKGNTTNAKHTTISPIEITSYDTAPNNEPSGDIVDSVINCDISIDSVYNWFLWYMGLPNNSVTKEKLETFSNLTYADKIYCIKNLVDELWDNEPVTNENID